jgi:transcription initiation factor IIE alpha subunit
MSISSPGSIVNIRERIAVNYHSEIELAHMTGNELKVFYMVTLLSRHGFGECFASVATICERTNLNKNTVFPILRILTETKHLIKNGVSAYGTNVYTLNQNYQEYIPITDQIRAKCKKPRKLKVVKPIQEITDLNKEIENTEQNQLLTPSYILGGEETQKTGLNYPKDNLIEFPSINQDETIKWDAVADATQEKNDKYVTNDENWHPGKELEEIEEESYAPSEDVQYGSRMGHYLCLPAKIANNLTQLAMQVNLTCLEALRKACRFYVNHQDMVNNWNKDFEEGKNPAPVEPKTILLKSEILDQKVYSKPVEVKPEIKFKPPTIPDYIPPFVNPQPIKTEDFVPVLSVKLEGILKDKSNEEEDSFKLFVETKRKRLIAFAEARCEQCKDWRHQSDIVDDIIYLQSASDDDILSASLPEMPLESPTEDVSPVDSIFGYSTDYDSLTSDSGWALYNQANHEDYEDY